MRQENVLLRLLDFIKCSPKWVKKLGVLAWKRNSFFLGVIYELSQIFQIFSIKTLSKYLHNINYLCYWGISASVNKVFFLFTTHFFTNSMQANGCVAKSWKICFKKFLASKIYYLKCRLGIGGHKRLLLTNTRGTKHNTFLTGSKIGVLKNCSSI